MMKLIDIIFIFFIQISLGLCCFISIKEKDALKTFYNYTNGYNWKLKCNHNWNFTNNPCNFYGVHCNSNCNIMRLNLSNCNLNGYLPTELSSITNLKHLELGNNHLYLTIPSSLFQLNNLKVLNLSTNMITGSIPILFNNLTSLQILDLSYNYLNSIIPLELFDCFQLIELYLNNNMLTGIMDSAIGNLQNITSISFNSNSLSGELPTTLGLLSNLQYLQLQINLFSKLCTEIGLLSNIQYLYLFSNQIEGTIPEEYGGLINVSRLWLFDNKLSGTIPDSIYDNCKKMWDLNLNTNRLTGSISSKIGKLTTLTQLFLFENLLTGSIPPELTKLKLLEYIQLNNNNLNGQIPSGLGYLPIRYLWLQNNSLSNTIPHTLGMLTTAEIIFIENNKLSGSIPNTFSNLVNVTYLFLQNNYLSGSLPDFSKLFEIICLNVDSNKLSGTVDDYLFNLPSLRYLYLSNNLFSGQIPSISNSSSLNYLFLENNKFDGTIPLGLVDMIAINLSGNKLKGNLQQLFNASSYSYKNLQYLIMSNLIVSGSLPDELFNSSSITSIVLSNNCITGNIPISICNATTLTSLIIDGISSSPYCPSSSQFGGTIPECLFALPNLQTLHLSASGLTGTIPDMTNSGIQDLSLSYNRLEGTIPKTILEHGSFNYFDISTNKLNGLVDRFISNSSNQNVVINMTFNRFSGQTKFDSDVTLNVLQGNLFGCPKPKSDIHVDSVECGSRNYTLTYLMWFILLLLWLVAYVFIFYVNFESVKKVRFQLILWWNAYYEYMSSIQDSSYHTRSFLSAMELITTLALVLCLSFLFIMMMTYVGLQSIASYSLYTYQYLYTPTVGFMQGIGPSIVVTIFIAFSGFLTATWMTIEPIEPDNQRSAVNGDGDTRAPIESVSTKSVATSRRISYHEEKLNHYNFTDRVVNLGFHFLITAISLGINLGFVGVVYYTNISPFALAVTQFIYALVKSILIQVYIPFAAKHIKAPRQGHIVSMIIVVMILSPAVATLFISPLCLFKLFHPDSITSNYIYPQYNYGCILRNIYYHCGFYKTFLTETGQYEIIINYIYYYYHYNNNKGQITPEWSYSYQCSSSLLTSYVTNFNFFYIINGMIIPAFNFIFIFLSSEEKVKHSMVLSKILYYFSDSDNVSIFRVFDHHHYNEHELETISSINNDNTQSIVKESPKVLLRDPLSFSVLRVLPQLCVDITILLTFGIASPILSILILFNILSTLMLWRVAIGRYFLIVSKYNTKSKYIERLESVFLLEFKCFENSWTIMSIFISLFWMLFIFDMLGNVSLLLAVISSFLFVIIIPSFFILTDRFYRRSQGIKKYIHSYCIKFHNSLWNKYLYNNCLEVNCNSDNNTSSLHSSKESTVGFTTSPFNHHHPSSSSSSLSS